MVQECATLSALENASQDGQCWHRYILCRHTIAGQSDTNFSWPHPMTTPLDDAFLDCIVAMQYGLAYEKSSCLVVLLMLPILFWCLLAMAQPNLWGVTHPPPFSLPSLITRSLSLSDHTFSPLSPITRSLEASKEFCLYRRVAWNHTHWATCAQWNPANADTNPEGNKLGHYYWS